jgi:hypothetical protein
LDLAGSDLLMKRLWPLITLIPGPMGWFLNDAAVAFWATWALLMGMTLLYIVACYALELRIMIIKKYGYDPDADDQQKQIPASADTR